MELKEFISESLAQILNGIEDAHTKLEANTHHPAIYHVGQTRNAHFDQTEKIEFEVLVHVESSKSGGGGAKISVLSLGISADAEVGLKQSQQNKIRFAVPVCFTKAIPPLKEDKDS